MSRQQEVVRNDQVDWKMNRTEPLRETEKDKHQGSEPPPTASPSFSRGSPNPEGMCYTRFLQPAGEHHPSGGR